MPAHPIPSGRPSSKQQWRQWWQQPPTAASSRKRCSGWEGWGTGTTTLKLDSDTMNSTYIYYYCSQQNLDSFSLHLCLDSCKLQWNLTFLNVWSTLEGTAHCCGKFDLAKNWWFHLVAELQTWQETCPKQRVLQGLFRHSLSQQLWIQEYFITVQFTFFLSPYHPCMVSYIYLHLVDIFMENVGKYTAYHTWMLWDQAYLRIFHGFFLVKPRSCLDRTCSICCLGNLSPRQRGDGDVFHMQPLSTMKIQHLVDILWINRFKWKIVVETDVYIYINTNFTYNIHIMI